MPGNIELVSKWSGRKHPNLSASSKYMSLSPFCAAFHRKTHPLVIIYIRNGPVGEKALWSGCALPEPTFTPGHLAERVAVLLGCGKVLEDAHRPPASPFTPTSMQHLREAQASLMREC